MKSPNISTRAANGFTLIEILLVIGLLTIIFGLGVFMSMDVWRGTSFRSERSVVVSLLQKARSQAMANLYERPWGVCTLNGRYVIFPGTTCSASDPLSTTLDASASATTTGLASGIVFEQLSGNSGGGEVVVIQDSRTATVTVNYEGTIDW